MSGESVGTWFIDLVAANSAVQIYVGIVCSKILLIMFEWYFLVLVWKRHFVSIALQKAYSFFILVYGCREMRVYNA